MQLPAATYLRGLAVRTLRGQVLSATHRCRIAQAQARLIGWIVAKLT